MSESSILFVELDVYKCVRQPWTAPFYGTCADHRLTRRFQGA